jgi:hypothetical protein
MFQHVCRCEEEQSDDEAISRLKYMIAAKQEIASPTLRLRATPSAQRERLATTLQAGPTFAERKAPHLFPPIDQL